MARRASRSPAVRPQANPTLHWTGPAERSSSFESWSVPGRPVNVRPLAAMGHRTTIHETFVARFQFGDPPTPMADVELDSVEAALDTKLPASFREFMTRFGPVHTPLVLDGITDCGLDHPDVQDFLSAKQAVENTKGYWSAGMPADVIGIASDCMGNMIGFLRSGERRDDAPVVFFDHDFVEVSEIASSFDEFLNWYLGHLDGS